MMESKLNILLMLLLAVSMATVLAQRRRTTSTSSKEWNYRDGSEKVNMRNVANLTQVLDNWRFDILSQMRNILQNEHQAVLPDYARIQPLSEALDDLYKEFNALKAHLGDLTEKFTAIEIFVDQLKEERGSGGAAAPVGNDSPAAAARQPVGRRVLKKKPSASS